MVHHRWNYKQNNKNIGLIRDYQRTVERTWHMVNKCKEMEQEYTGNNCTRHLVQPYLLSNMDELNILADAIENKIGLHYNSLLFS